MINFLDDDISIANEAYLGNLAIKDLIPIINNAQKFYISGNEKESFKEIIKLSNNIKNIFNFKKCTINVNNTTFGFRWHDIIDLDSPSINESVTRCEFLTAKGAFNVKASDIIIKNNTYRFKKPIVRCDLSIYAPKMLNSKITSPEVCLALILREIGYSFYICTVGDKIYGVGILILRNLTKVFSLFPTPGISIMGIVKSGLGAIIPGLYEDSVKSKPPTSSGFLKFLDKVVNFGLTGVKLLLAPIVGIIAIVLSPFALTMKALTNLIGLHPDECDKFADQFVASYGLGHEVIKGIHNEQYGDGKSKILGLVADFTGLSAILYTGTSLNIGSTNCAAVMPRLDSVINYYNYEMANTKDPGYKSTLKNKIKVLNDCRNKLQELPENKYSIGQFFIRLCDSISGSKMEAMERLDKEANKQR